MEHFFIIVLFYLFHTIVAKWQPSLDFQVDIDQFQFYQLDSSLNVIYRSTNQRLPEKFEWHTVAAVTLPSTNSSFIMFGGSQQIDTNSASAFNKKLSIVVLCRLKMVNEYLTFDDTRCTTQNNHTNGNLGAAIKALSLTNDEAVLVYCDPLWHKEIKKESKPSGKCYLSLLNNQPPREVVGLEFCRLSSTSYETCMGGFSVDLISSNNEISGIEMIVGMPHAIPYGGVNIIKDPFGEKSFSEPRNGVGKYFNFGYAVSMTTDGSIYISSPLSDQYLANVTEIKENTRITSPDNDPFSSFGVALTTLSINQGKSRAVVVGAPFHTIKSIENVGKIYIFCVTKTNRSFLTGSVHGQEKDEFFGYSLANIGDINGDGNEDVAISSPFLRHDDARGFVSLFTVHKNCEIKQKPHQILKTRQKFKNGIFGISIAGGSDLDFNNWPDIVVTSTKSNSIEFFASRLQYKAQCKFNMDHNYEAQTLGKDENIKINLYLTLLDIKKDNLINMENFLKTFSIISQIDANINTDVNRFDLKTQPKYVKITRTNVLIEFSIRSLQHVRDMNLTNPINVAYQFVENCTKGPCDNLRFPLISWDQCIYHIPVKKYVCSNSPICNADISLQLTDELANEVFFGYDKSYHRLLQMRIFNSGPTESKDINLRISTTQNLRINKISSKDPNIKDIISSNQTEAVVKLEQLELEINSFSFTINIDLYFIDFKDPDKMKYENNSIIMQLFSDIMDGNLTNNVARIDYVFIYEPNITFSSASKQDPVMDSRMRSQQLIRGTRMALDSIGPRYQEAYLVYNVGKGPITNMTLRIRLPMYTEDKYNILYLFKNIRSINNSIVTWMSIVPQVTVDNNKYLCSLPTTFVNPLDIIGFETHESHLSDIDMTRLDDSKHFISKRSADQSTNNGPANLDNDVKFSPEAMHRIPMEAGVSTFRQIINCNRSGNHLSSPVCADVVCEIPILPPNKQARVQINAWLLAHTFFKKQISDISVYTTVEPTFHSLPRGVSLRYPKREPYSQHQRFIFKNVKPKLVHIKPTWPIIVGIVIGILILAILIVAMYKCGFFKRNKRHRHFRSSKSKRLPPVIVHSADIQMSSSLNTDNNFTSHSELINNK